MVATKYSKSVTTDFTGLEEDAPHVASFIEEIQNSSIVTALDHVSRDGDDVDVWFKEALSAGDQTALSSVVAAHTGVYSFDEEPHVEDGKRYVTPDLFPLGYFAVHAGCSDDVSAGTRGTGSRGAISLTAAGPSSVDFQFIDHVLLAGGSLVRVGGTIDDYVDMKVYAPATAGASNPGSGSYDLSNGKYVYSSGGNGDWDLNLTEKLNANVDFTKAVPIPNAAGLGWFDYNKTSNILSLNADQKGKYDLYAVAVDLTQHVRKAPLLHEGKMCDTVAAVKPALILPHWKIKVTVTEGGADHNLDVVWKLFIGRKATT